MNKFVRIRNKADFVDRRRLEKLGLSTKRDNEDTIGQFGSGAKLAPIAALRKGIRWITVAEDEVGPYKMEFVGRDVDGVNTVFYKYDDYEKESSFTVDAGVLSWDEDFQIFREAFANALDEGDYEITVGVVDDFVYEPGYVDVYLSAAPEVMEIHNNFDQYFCIDRTPIVNTEFGQIYSASRHKSVRIFNKGVFVLDLGSNWTTKAGRSNTYDYGFIDIKLNEERRVKSEYEVERLIARLYHNIPDDFAGRKLIKSIIKNEPDEFHNYLGEHSFFSEKASEAWKNVWYETNGDKAVPVGTTTGSQIISSNLKALDFVPILVSTFLYSLLKRAGVDTAETILGDRSNIEAIECPAEYAETFAHALRTVTRYDSRIANYNIEVMKSESVLGIFSGGNNPTIFVSTLSLSNGLRNTVETLIHELDHAITGADDYSRRMRDSADTRIGDLVLSMGYDTDLTPHDGEIRVPISYISTLGGLRYQIVATELGSILSIGGQRFFIEEILDEREGVMETTEDEMFVIRANGIRQDTDIKRI